MPDNKKALLKGPKRNKGNKEKEKARLHPRNKNRERYDFKQLIAKSPDLAKYVKLNLYNSESIDFADSEAVKALNKAILYLHYGIEYWDIPEDYLCPPIPGRADYIHHIADLMCQNNFGTIPIGSKFKCLDVGVGANCIYPIIGNSEYGWSFVGADIDPIAIESANKIASSNISLKKHVECRLQRKPKDIFYGVIRKDEFVDLVICNPPFHSNAKEARASSLRKLSNLNKTKITNASLNFGGQNNELWCNGGEKGFVGRMIRESKKFGDTCFWFSTLVSKQSNLKYIYTTLEQVEAVKVETIPMGQGNKTSRIVAWTFLPPEEQKKWKTTKWRNQKPSSSPAKP